MRTTDDIEVELALTPAVTDLPCADIAQRAVVTISGLEVAPGGLRVTEDGGALTVPVENAGPGPARAR